MSSQTALPTSAASFGIGTAWATPANARLIDGVYTTCALNAASSKTLLVSSYGFTIPLDARIDGVRVEMLRHTSGGTITDQVALSTGGSPQNGSAWPTADRWTYYGGPKNTWGAILTPAIINATAFGVALFAANAGALQTASIDAVRVTVWYTRPTDQTAAVVTIRDPNAPHAPLATVLPIAGSLQYGFMLMRSQTAVFRVARTDPNLVQFARYFDLGYMISIERPDGNLPWVGYIKKVRAPSGDPSIEITAQDHTWLLNGGHTRASGHRIGASGPLIVDTLREMDGRAYPPLDMRYDLVESGTLMDITFELIKGDDFLNKCSQMTGWEWGFVYDVSSRGVQTYLKWAQRLGTDRRANVVWEETKHFAEADYERHADAYVGAAVVVGGSGDFATRTLVTANTRRAGLAGASSVTAQSGATTAPATSPALQRSRILIDRQVSSPSVLASAAQRMHDSPDETAEMIGFSVLESEIDVTEYNLGDTVIARLNTTYFGTPITRAVRLMAQDINDFEQVHKTVTQVVR